MLARMKKSIHRSFRALGFDVRSISSLEGGCEVLISIDDDDYAPEGTDFVGSHLEAVGPEVKTRLARGDAAIKATGSTRARCSSSRGSPSSRTPSPGCGS